MNYWLMKVEPSAYSIENLERDGTTNWDGVRNFQARNYIRAMGGELEIIATFPEGQVKIENFAK